MITPHRCPVCEKSIANAAADGDRAYFPFCSDRCRKVDFHRWWDGRYAITEEVDPQVAEFMAEDPDVTVEGRDTDH